MSKGKRIGKTAGMIGVVVVPQLFYNQLWNIYYKDICPPPKGVTRRVEEE